MPKNAKTWHGDQYYVGLHFDIHALESDPTLGSKSTTKHLIEQIKNTGADFAQTDCKGHPGFTSWPSKTPTASVPKDLPVDLLRRWRKATQHLKQPLHGHYSGIIDRVAAKRFPEWLVVRPPGAAEFGPVAKALGPKADTCMCPRSPYLEQLMIPQLEEALARYDLDGFWIDGDVWAVYPCYCHRCTQAFVDLYPGSKPPLTPQNTKWKEWISFTRRSFEDYVNRYVAAVHAKKPGALVCSNWLHTLKHPGPMRTDTDWISGDNTWVWSIDSSRCESRFISTRGKHWDIMLWTFFRSVRHFGPGYSWEAKPAQMLQQEAAITIALGGSIQLYCHVSALRDGRLVPWRQEIAKEVVTWIKQRRTVCQNTDTIPQVAVLHSEQHCEATSTGVNLMWDNDVSAVEGATLALLECHYGVDILDEWALTPRLDDFPVLVMPEQFACSDALVAQVKAWVERGGRLLVSGKALGERFGWRFLGVKKGSTDSYDLEAIDNDRDGYFIPADEASTLVLSQTWHLTSPTSAAAIGRLSRSVVRTDPTTGYLAASINQVGRGRVGYIPFDVFSFFQKSRQQAVRKFIKEVCSQLDGDLDYQLKAPVFVDMVLRRKGKKRIVHLINRNTGIPNSHVDGTIDEIPPVGPITLSIKAPATPSSIRLAFEKGNLTWKRVGKRIDITVSQIHIHSAIVIDDSAPPRAKKAEQSPRIKA